MPRPIPRPVPPPLTGRRLAASLAVVLVLAPIQPSAADADPVVAQRGSVSLTASAVRGLLANLDPAQQQRLRDNPQALAGFVRDHLLQTAILTEARAKQWDQRPEIAARAEAAQEAVIADSYLAAIAQPDSGYPSEKDIADAYEANKAKLLLPRQYLLSQIFVAVATDATPGADAEAQARLAALRRQWLKAKGDPAAVVRTSPGAPAAAAADLGWVREDRLAPAIRPVVAGLAEGAISEPIHTADGWHIVRMADTRPASPASLAEVHDTLARALRQARQEQNAHAHLDALLQQSPIQLNEIELSHLTSK